MEAAALERQPRTRWADAQPTHDSVLPDADLWCRTFATAILQVLDGRRRLESVSRMLCPRLNWELRHHLATRPVQTRPRITSVTSVHISRPSTRVIEATAVVQIAPDMFRAIAFRVEGLDGRWQTTEWSVV